MTGIYYGDSTPNTTNFNYTIIGSSTGLSWTNVQYSGPLTGDAHEQNDTGNHIVLAAGAAPINPRISAVYASSVTVTWGTVGSSGYSLEASHSDRLHGVLDFIRHFLPMLPSPP